MQRDARPVLAGQQHMRVGLVVAQGNVVARRQRLDQLVFQQERLGFRARDSDVHARDLRDHRHDPRVLRAAIEIAADAVAQRTRLAHVQQGVVGRVHAVHAGCGAEMGREGLAIKGRGGNGPGAARRGHRSRRSRPRRRPPPARPGPAGDAAAAGW
ncbi:hypothetical protein G6F32_015029 [Rhizopus arrhizus]|nr:hypothetical protein G6F32_015029 [Rhizopus arrhizus]